MSRWPEADQHRILLALRGVAAGRYLYAEIGPLYWSADPTNGWLIAMGRRHDRLRLELASYRPLADRDHPDGALREALRSLGWRKTGTNLYEVTAAPASESDLARLARDVWDLVLTTSPASGVPRPKVRTRGEGCYWIGCGSIWSFLILIAVFTGFAGQGSIASWLTAGGALLTLGLLILSLVWNWNNRPLSDLSFKADTDPEIWGLGSRPNGRGARATWIAARNAPLILWTLTAGLTLATFLIGPASEETAPAAGIAIVALWWLLGIGLWRALLRGRRRIERRMRPPV